MPRSKPPYPPEFRREAVELARVSDKSVPKLAKDLGISDQTSKGDCFDNAVAESFFATLKKELVHRRSWPTRRELQSAVFDYIETFYNRERRHSTLGYLSPSEFEMMISPSLKSEEGKSRT